MRNYPVNKLLGVFLILTSLEPAAGLRQSAGQSRAAKPAGATSYINPVFDRDFPDPTIIRASDGWYYAYATQTIVDNRTMNIQVARSKDLRQWEHLGDALPAKPKWASETQKFWAPHVSQHKDTFYMYYSAEPDTRAGLCLAVATSKSPAGPFTDVGRPLKCGEGFINIDPMAFDDPKTGKRLLYWGSGFQPIKVQEMAEDRISFEPGSKPVDLIFPNPKAGPEDYQRLVEGAWVIERNKTYYLFYSGDNCCGDKAHYAVMVARSKSATGPFQTLARATGKPQSVILEQGERWIAPGHNSVIRDAAGQDWTFYHAIDSKNRYIQKIEGDRDVRRVMLMDPVSYRNGWPQIGGGYPSTNRGRGPVVE